MKFNDLTLIAKTISGTYIPEDALNEFRNLNFETFYPGGLFGGCSFTLPRDVRQKLLFHGGHKLYIYNGVKLVWEGLISDIQEEARGGAQGSFVEGLGAWGAYLERLSINKRWVDDRTEESVWVYDETQSGAALFTIDRDNRIRITPKNEQVSGVDRAILTYTMPTGQTIKRVTMDYDFNENGNDVAAAVFHNNDSDGANTFTDLTNAYDGDTSTTVNVTLTTDDYLYVKQPNTLDRMTAINFFLSAYNNNVATMGIQRFTGNHVQVTPLGALHYSASAGTYTDLTNVYDDDTGSNATVFLKKGDYLYLRTHEAKVLGFEFDMSTPNVFAADLKVQAYDAATTDWKNVSIVEDSTGKIGTRNEATPLGVKHDDGGSFSDLTNTYDDDGGTSSTITISDDDFLYIRTNYKRIQGLRFNLGATVNTNVARMRLQRYDGDLAAWTNVTIENETEAKSATGDMIPFARDGSIRFSNDVVTSTVTVDSVSGLWWRLAVSADLSSVEIIEIYELQGTNEFVPFAADGKVLLTESAETSQVTVNSTAGLWWRFHVNQEIRTTTAIAEIYTLIGWESVTYLTDATASGGATLAQTGLIDWNFPGYDIAETKVNGVNGLWYRFRPTANLDQVTITEIRIQDRMNWVLRLYDTVGATALWTVTASGTGSQDVTLGTARQALQLQFYFSGGVVLPPSNGTIYGEINTIQMYSETGTINTYEVLNDIRGALSAYLSANTDLLDNTKSVALTPNFITNLHEYYASITERAAGVGNSDGAPLGYGLVSSQRASDGLPKMFLELWPDTSDPTSYDYQVRLETAQIPKIRRDDTNVINWVSVSYTDERGWTQIVTPDDDSSLKDTTSITKYGQRNSPVLSVGNGDQTLAIAYGVRYLAANKDPQISVTGPIVVTDYIEHRGGFIVPASEILAGKVVRFMDYEGGDILGVITATSYDHESRTCSLTLGYSDSLAIQLARGLL